MSLQLNIRKYEEKDFERLCQVHDPARKSELEYAGLPAAFLPLSIAAEREGLFEYQVYVAEDKGLVVGFIAFSDTALCGPELRPAGSRVRADAFCAGESAG